MLPRTHAILGILFSLALVYFFSLSLTAGIIIFLSSVLIDVDHYIYYVCKKKDWSLRRAYTKFIYLNNKLLKIAKKDRKKYFTAVFFLHGFEILAILSILGFFVSEYFYFVLIGFSFHLLLDITYGIFIVGRVDRVSLVYDFIKEKNLKSILF